MMCLRRCMYDYVLCMYDDNFLTLTIMGVNRINSRITLTNNTRNLTYIELQMNLKYSFFIYIKTFSHFSIITKRKHRICVKFLL